MGTDKTQFTEIKPQVSLLSVRVVKFDEGLKIVSPFMSAALPLWSKILLFLHTPAQGWQNKAGAFLRHIRQGMPLENSTTKIT